MGFGRPLNVILGMTEPCILLSTKHQPKKIPATQLSLGIRDVSFQLSFIAAVPYLFLSSGRSVWWQVKMHNTNAYMCRSE